MTDALNEYSYDAELAGLTYSFDVSSLGLYISISGYNDKIHVLLRDVLEKAKSMEVRADRLGVMKEKVNDVSQIPLSTLSIRLTSSHRSNATGRTFSSVRAINYQITTGDTS